MPDCEWCKYSVGDALRLHLSRDVKAFCEKCGAITFSGPKLVTGIYKGLHYSKESREALHWMRLDDPVLCPGCQQIMRSWTHICDDGSQQLFIVARYVYREAQ